MSQLMSSPWRQRIVGSASGMIADEAELRRALELFADPKAGCELMALTSGVHKTLRGDKLDELVKAAKELPGGIGLYFRFNPVLPAPGRPAKDADVIARRWLFVDVDPVRKEGFADNPAADAEKGRTAEVADEVTGHLSGKGWPEPVVTDSGNGHGLFWRCDLPNDELVKTTYRSLLKDLAKRFGGSAQIDTAVFNASRLAKLPGTWARKGAEAEGRPHRPCRLVSVPDELKAVTWELLQGAAPRPEEKKPTPVMPAVPRVSGNGKHSAYEKKAIEGITGDVLAAPGGTRNHTLFKKAAHAGNRAAAGFLDAENTKAALIAAGKAADPERGDIAATVERGFAKGLQEPIAPEALPEPPRIVFGKTELGKAVEAGEKQLTVKLAAVKPLEVDWLVPGRIPKRFVTIFAGRTGVGKSFVACDLIARLTTGGEIPGGGGECFKPGGALVISEDSHEYVLAPRMIAMGADLNRINAMTWEAMGHYHLGDTDMLDCACNEVEGGVSFVLIDPPTNFLGDEVDEHKNSDVRQLVMKVVEWAFGRDLACAFVLHINKPTGKGTDAINRVMGSVAWVTTARVAHSMCLDPDDRSRCLWVPIKNNLGPVGKGLAYRIEGKPAVVNWLGEVEMTADEAMSAEPQARKKAVVAADWLVDRFREKTEWPSDELFEAAKQQGVSRNALFAAKDSLCLPRARQEHLENGDRRFVWWVPKDWARLTKENNGTMGQ